MKFEKQRFIHFREADPAGILFFGRLPEIYHDLFEEGLQEQLPWRELFANERLALPIRHLEVDYLRPMRAGVFYTWLVNVMKLTDHSVEVHLQVLHENHLHAHLKCVHVCVDQQAAQKTKLPAQWRAALEALQ